MAKQKKLASNVMPIAPLSTTLAVLLDQMQNRISDVANRGANNSDQISALGIKVDAITTNAAAGFVEQKKAIADNATGTTYALESLKTSTQRALDGVASDIKSASDCAQRHNARISKLEGNADKTASGFLGVCCQQVAFDDRLAKLEAKATSSTETSSLETELRALLKRYGYSINGVTVAKTTYAPIPTNGWISGSISSQSQNSGGLQAGISLRGSEGIEIKLNGTKAL